MRIYTNLAWPDDPYRTSQQLYKRPSPILAAFAVIPPARAACAVPAAVAIAYLPLHRTRAITVTEGTLAFGFRAASTAGAEEICELTKLADLDLMQARRHAGFLAGHQLPASTHALREATSGLVTRGLDAVEADWADRPARVGGCATMVDVETDCGDGATNLADVCRNANVEASAASLTGIIAASGAAEGSVTVEHLAAAAAERALAIALTCAWHLGRYYWDGVLGTARVMATTTWDLFPQVTWDHNWCPQPIT